jgi:hypothetical protein
VKFFLSFVFLASGVAKLIEHDASTNALISTGLLQVDAAAFFATVIPACELLLAVFLVVPQLRNGARFLGIPLLSSFLSFHIWRAFFAPELPCSCFGTVLTLSPWVSAAIAALGLAYLALQVSGTVPLPRSSTS